MLIGSSGRIRRPPCICLDHKEVLRIVKVANVPVQEWTSRIMLCKGASRSEHDGLGNFHMLESGGDASE